METKDYFLVLGPLLGITLGGLITTAVKALELRVAWKTSRMNSKIDRLETMFARTSSMLTKYIQFTLATYVLLEAESEPEVRRDKIRSFYGEEIEIYASLVNVIGTRETELRKYFEAVEESQNRVKDSVMAFAAGNNINNDEQVTESLNSLTESADALQTAIRAEIDDLENCSTFSFFFRNL